MRSRAACGSIRWRCAASTCWQAADLPYTMATGEVLADITPRETLEAALAAIGYRRLSASASRPTREQRHLPAGWASAPWSSPPPTARRSYKSAGIPGSGHEAAWVRIEPSGAVNASVRPEATGQGYETSLANAVAEGLGVEPGERAAPPRATPTSRPTAWAAAARAAARPAAATLYLCAPCDARAKVLAIAAQRCSGCNSSGELRMRDGPRRATARRRSGATAG